jgi:hypothetical protein
MTSGPGARSHHHRIDALQTRLSGLDLRDVFGTILGAAGTVIAVTQLTSLERPAGIVVIVAETLLITSIFVILPSKEERLKRERKRIKKFERVALLSVVVTAVLVWIGAAHFFTLSDAVQVRTFDPFTIYGKIQPDFQVKTVTGSCWERSVVDTRPDAWRCTSGDQIHDPCFDNIGEFVVCAANPWANNVTRIDLTSPLNWRLMKLPESDSEAPFWALTLATGVECVLVPGTSAVIDGHRVNYSCQDGYLVSSVDASNATAQVQSPGASTFGIAGILVAWN